MLITALGSKPSPHLTRHEALEPQGCTRNRPSCGKYHALPDNGRPKYFPNQTITVESRPHSSGARVSCHMTG